jgi:hypothetical protein
MKHTKPIRWTVEKAASEFNINPRTLAKRIRTDGTEPGKDGRFSTVQICAAVYGAIEAEKLRKIMIEADLLAIDKKERTRDVVPTAQVLKAWEVILVGLRQKIMFAEKLTEDEKREMLLDLQTIPVDEYFRDDKPIEFGLDV